MILVVDDDPALMRAIARQLAILGYAVVTAKSADEALAQLERHSVRGVISDYDLGRGATGASLLSMVARINPMISVVLWSGAERIAPPGVPFLTKPAATESLLQALHLDEPRAVAAAS